MCRGMRLEVLAAVMISRLSLVTACTDSLKQFQEVVFQSLKEFESQPKCDKCIFHPHPSPLALHRRYEKHFLGLSVASSLLWHAFTQVVRLDLQFLYLTGKHLDLYNLALKCLIASCRRT